MPRLIPLLGQEKAAVREAAFRVLADIANDVSAPGREADRAAMTDSLMTLVSSVQPQAVRLLGLRLLPIVIPPDHDVGPIAALLDEPTLREKAREALEETATPACRAALRGYLARAEPDFRLALVESLGRLRDRGSLEAIAQMAGSVDPRLRTAAARALAWTGDPAYLLTVRSIASSADSMTHSDASDALIRLINAIEKQGEHPQVAADAYRDLLTRGQGPARDAALAGLGRTGDETDVPRILQTVRDAELPTLLVGTAALRALKGPDVTRALVKAYPELPLRVRRALIPVLGSKDDPQALAILEEEARSDDPGSRAAALEAIGEAGRAKGKKVEGIAASGSKRDLAGLAGTVSKWWVVGPFDLGEKDKGWETRHIGEPDVSTVARYMSGKTRVQWKPVRSEDPQGKIDLRASLANRDHCVGYAYAEILLERPAEAVLLLGVDDSEKVWVNGEKVFELFTSRGLRPDQDRVPVKLKAGTNTILLKLYQDTLGWEFCADRHPRRPAPRVRPEVGLTAGIARLLPYRPCTPSP